MELAKRFGFLVLLVWSFTLAQTAEAASVYNCSKSGKKCVAKVEEGIIGDSIRVLDEKASVVANGRIIKRRGAYALISISNKSKSIRRGYPVIVEIQRRNANLEWAASFSNQD